MCRAEGGANNFGVFRGEKTWFYAKKSYSFQLRREVRKMTILRQKIIFFLILGGGARARCAPLYPPLNKHYIQSRCEHETNMLVFSLWLDMFNIGLLYLLQKIRVPLYLFTIVLIFFRGIIYFSLKIYQGHKAKIILHQGRIQDFKLGGGGGGGALKKIAPSGGRRENFWGISCEKSRFYSKQSYIFQF